MKAMKLYFYFMFIGKQDKFEIYEKSYIFKRIKRCGFTLRPLGDTDFFLRQSNLKTIRLYFLIFVLNYSKKKKLGKVTIYKLPQIHKLNKPIKRPHLALFLVISS